MNLQKKTRESSEFGFGKSKRMVECGHDVVILLDSITRLARAYNTVTPASGKVLSGGVDANAMHKTKEIFRGCRKIENGGSLPLLRLHLLIQVLNGRSNLRRI